MAAGHITDKTPKTDVRKTFVTGGSDDAFTAAWALWDGAGRPDDADLVTFPAEASEDGEAD